MAKIGGENALVYLGGTEVPQRNSWSIDVTRELREAKVFQGGAAGASWVENSAGFKSWSGSLDGYYDNADETLVAGSVQATAEEIVLLYEDRGTLTRFWYGVAFLDMSETVGADGFVDLNTSMTGTGALVRHSS
jgi:hypothetical protein